MNIPMATGSFCKITLGKDEEISGRGVNDPESDSCEEKLITANSSESVESLGCSTGVEMSGESGGLDVVVLALVW